MFLSASESGDATQVKMPAHVVRKLHEDPVGYLRRALAGGFAVPETFRSCLSLLLKNSKTKVDRSRYLKDSKAGNLIVNWLWSTGNSRSLHFLQDHRMTHLFIQIFVIERRQDMIDSWIRADEGVLSKDSKAQDPSWIRSRLLLEYLKAETTLGRGTESALETFEVYLQEKSLLDGDGTNRNLSTKNSRIVFGPSGHYLMRHIREQVMGGQLDVSLYFRLRTTAHQWSHQNGFEAAWLALYNPSRPDPGPTLQYLRGLSLAAVAHLTSHRQAATADLLLKAAEVYLAQERQKLAFELMTAIRQYFPKVIGLQEVSHASPPHTTTNEKTEDRTHLHLLENLAIG